MLAGFLAPEMITVTNGVRVYKAGKICIVSIDGVSNTQTSGTRVLGTIPAGWRPGNQPSNGIVRGGSTLFQAWIGSSGIINVMPTNTNTIAGTFVYVQEN